jgi:hypothetical protein
MTPVNGVQFGVQFAAVGQRPTAPRTAHSGTNLDQARIDRLLAETYALDGGLPMIPGPDAPTSDLSDGSPSTDRAPGSASASGSQLTSHASRPQQPPSWLHTAERIDAPVPPHTTLGIPMGAHIRARLKTNLDSRTAGEGYVEAVLERPFSVSGEVKLPPRTMAYGRASAPQGRFQVHFTLLVLPEGREVPIDALAYDSEERKAGLKPTRATTNDKRQTPSKASQVARDTGQVLVGAISQGDVASEAAQRAAQDALTDDGSASGTQESVAYVDAGLDFDLFVTRGL